VEEIILDSEPEAEDNEATESNMQVDTDTMPAETRTTMLVSFVSLCTGTGIQLTTSHQTSVSVTHMEDTPSQPALKKAKTEPGKGTPVETSVDAVESKKTQAAGTESKSRSDYKNSDLPIVVDHKWSNAFMDTVILWAGGQPNIWSIPDEALATALQKIFTVVYPDVQYEVTINSAVFGVVCYSHVFVQVVSLVALH
jgi:hypothetical protein